MDFNQLPTIDVPDHRPTKIMKTEAASSTELPNTVNEMATPWSFAEVDRIEQTSEESHDNKYSTLPIRLTPNKSSTQQLPNTSQADIDSSHQPAVLDPTKGIDWGSVDGISAMSDFEGAGDDAKGTEEDKWQNTDGRDATLGAEVSDSGHDAATEVHQETINDNNEDNAQGEEDINTPTEQEVAQEVAEVAAAAAVAWADAAIDEQTRWLYHLSRDNPDEYQRLAEAGIIGHDSLIRVDRMTDDDLGAVPQDQPNNADHQGNDTAPASNADQNEANAVVDTLESAENNDRTDDAAADQDDGSQNIAGNNQATPTGALAAQVNDGIAQTNPLPHDDHFIWLSDRRDGRDENIICPACQCEFDDSELLVYLNCGHKWCADCLNSNYRSALRNRNDFPPQCCDIPLEHDSVQQFLDEDLLVNLITKMDEFNDTDPIYCQTEKCTGGYIPRGRIDGQWASCAECRHSTCVECKAPATDHPMPKMHPKLLAKLDEELADKEGWKQCPGCKNLIERTAGCNFMSCECGHQFCYQCGGTLMNNMPCACQGTPAWVQQMNDEAAGEGKEDSGEDDDERDEEDEESDADEEGGEGGENEVTEENDEGEMNHEDNHQGPQIVTDD